MESRNPHAIFTGLIFTANFVGAANCLAQAVGPIMYPVGQEKENPSVKRQVGEEACVWNGFGMGDCSRGYWLDDVGELPKLRTGFVVLPVHPITLPLKREHVADSIPIFREIQVDQRP